MHCPNVYRYEKTPSKLIPELGSNPAMKPLTRWWILLAFSYAQIQRGSAYWSAKSSHNGKRDFWRFGNVHFLWGKGEGVAGGISGSVIWKLYDLPPSLPNLLTWPLPSKGIFGSQDVWISIPWYVLNCYISLDMNTMFDICLPWSKYLQMYWKLFFVTNPISSQKNENTISDLLVITHPERVVTGRSSVCSSSVAMNAKMTSFVSSSLSQSMALLSYSSLLSWLVPSASLLSALLLWNCF